MAYRDGELARRRAGKVASHLGQCAECRRELARLEAEFEQLVAVEAVPLENPNFQEGLKKLLEGLREWQLAGDEPVQPEVRERVASQLEMFFGSRAAASVGRAAGARPDHPSVLPLFAAFLGEKAAALLASRAIGGMEFTEKLVAEQAK